MKSHHVSYGIIPIYKKDNQLYVCAVQNKKSNMWGLPKGTPEHNETGIQTAIRELYEETGISNFEIIGGKMFEEEYSFIQDSIQHHKKNIYYIAFVSEMKQKQNFIDSLDMHWIPILKANAFFSFDSLKKIIQDVYAYLIQFPLTTTYTNQFGDAYMFEYYDSDSLEHISYERKAQVQVFAFLKDKLLIVNNANRFNEYSPIGGSIEKNETPEECLFRELREESNMFPIEYKLIGYQKCTNLSNLKKLEEYQFRYVAQVEPLGPFTPACDPDGDVTELLEIDPKEYKKYFDWGVIGDHLIGRALKMYRDM